MNWIVYEALKLATLEKAFKGMKESIDKVKLINSDMAFEMEQTLKEERNRTIYFLEENIKKYRQAINESSDKSSKNFIHRLILSTTRVLEKVSSII